MTINELIFEAAINKQPIFDSFKSVCKSYPTQTIDYVDFEWKYYQFYHGNRDLTIERSPENSSPLTFTDLPMDVLENVVTNLDFLDCMALQKVSRDLRNLAESTNVHCELMEIEFDYNGSSIDIEGVVLSYDQAQDGFCNVVLRRIWPQETKEYSCQGNHDQLLIADVSKVLKNPKLKIDRLSLFTEYMAAASGFLKFLKSLNFQLDVRSISISTCEDLNSSTVHSLFILPILQCLKPERLEEIELGRGLFIFDQFGEIAETEQWKKAKKLCWRPCLRIIRMEKLLNFKNIEIHSLQYSDDHLIAIRDLLCKSDHLELCHLTISHITWKNEDGIDENGEKLEYRMNNIMSQNPRYDSETRRFSIPNSDDYFQLEYILMYSKYCGALIGLINRLTVQKVLKNR